ncbi:MAG: hypothetical protein H6978_16485 [Gammaproteobacteria bacterium]|nr:hypothetical protein [Gammaproteobacteria bacterium]
MTDDLHRRCIVHRLFTIGGWERKISRGRPGRAMLPVVDIIDVSCAARFDGHVWAMNPRTTDDIAAVDVNASIRANDPPILML